MSSRSCSLALRVFFEDKSKLYNCLMNSNQRALLTKMFFNFSQS